MTGKLTSLTGRTSTRQKQVAAHKRLVDRYQNDLDGLLRLQKLWSNSADEHSEELEAVNKALTVCNARAWSGELPAVNDTILQLEAEAVAKAVRKLSLTK